MHQDRYPVIFRLETGSMSLIGGPTGWQTILERLFGELEELVQHDISEQKYSGEEALAIRQVKAKFGELVVYTAGVRTEAINQAIRAAHATASRTCDMCGGSALSRSGELQVRCDRHVAMAWHEYVDRP